MNLPFHSSIPPFLFLSLPPYPSPSIHHSLHILPSLLPSLLLSLPPYPSPSQSEHQLPGWWQRLESWGDCHEVSLTNWNQPLQHWEPNPWKARMSVWYILSCMADHRARGHSHSSVWQAFLFPRWGWCSDKPVLFIYHTLLLMALHAIVCVVGVDLVASCDITCVIMWHYLCHHVTFLVLSCDTTCVVMWHYLCRVTLLVLSCDSLCPTSAVSWRWTECGHNWKTRWGNGDSHNKGKTVHQVHSLIHRPLVRKKLFFLWTACLDTVCMSV